MKQEMIIEVILAINLSAIPHTTTQEVILLLTSFTFCCCLTTCKHIKRKMFSEGKRVTYCGLV